MTKRVSLGKWVDGSYRLRVSAPGFDVDNTALTKSQLIFDSTMSNGGFRIASGSYALPSGTFSTPTKLIGWPDLGYSPAIHLDFDGMTWLGVTWVTDYCTNNNYAQDIFLFGKSDGLYASGTFVGGFMRYIVYSMKVL